MTQMMVENALFIENRISISDCHNTKQIILVFVGTKQSFIESVFHLQNIGNMEMCVTSQFIILQV